MIIQEDKVFSTSTIVLNRLETVRSMSPPADEVDPYKDGGGGHGNDIEEEELLRDDPNRFCLFPIRYADIWKFYKDHKDAFWTAEEIDFGADKSDWEKLTDNEKYFIEHILAFFAGSDGIVLENLVKNFCQEITVPEARCFYAFQAAMENIHCVAADTEILTDNGWITIGHAVGKVVNVWNGETFSSTTIVATGDAPLWRVFCSNGLSIDTTSDHKWYLDVEGKETLVLMRQLMIGDRLWPYELPMSKDPFLLPSTKWEVLNRPFETREVFITHIQPLEGIHPTFCFNEPKRHRGVFNGILTGQSEVYSLMIDTFVQDPDRKMRLYQAVTEIPCVEKKANWALKWIHESTKSNLGKRLFAFGIVEGLFFSGSFCAIFWLKERGLLIHSLGKSNEWIARDEGLHTRFAILLYKYVRNKPSQEEAHMMMYDAVRIEEDFICNSLPVSLIGMNSEMMKKYIRYVADRLLLEFGYEKIFRETNPFPFMEKISLDGKTNFFEQRVSEYSLYHNSNSSNMFALDDLEKEDF